MKYAGTESIKIVTAPTYFATILTVMATGPNPMLIVMTPIARFIRDLS